MRLFSTRTLLRGFFSLLVLSCCVSSAQAGWQLTYKYSWKNTYKNSSGNTVYGSGLPKVPGFPQAGTHPAFEYSSNAPEISAQSNSNGLISELKIWAVYTWNGSVGTVPKYLIVAQRGEARATAEENSPTGQASCDHNVPGFNPTLDTGGLGTQRAVSDTCGGSSETVTRVSRGAKIEVRETNGGTTFEFGPHELKSEANVTNPPYQTYNLVNGTSVNYGARIVTMTPYPNGDPLWGDNEYVMMGGQAPFSIPCSINVGWNDVMDDVRTDSVWAISSGLTPRLPLLDNYWSWDGSVFPRFTSNADGPPGSVMTGMGFSLLNGLPNNNATFGPNSVSVQTLGATIAAPVEIFYASGASNHPLGGPPGYEPMSGSKFTDHSVIDPYTPNWLYYYNQAYPFWLPIEYVNNSLGGYYSNGDNHIHVGNAAHGAFNGPLIKMVNGNISWIGTIQTYGIDTYARVLHHEAEHKQMYDINYTDSDDDGVDDNYELGIGLRTNDSDSLGVGAYLAQFAESGLYSSDSGDSEAVARLAEWGKEGPRDKDWADDGLNKGTVPGPNSAYRTLKLDRNGLPMS